MIKFELLVCAENLMKDPEKDTFSAINILEDFVTESMPAFIPKFNVLLITSVEGESPNKIANTHFTISNNSTIIHESDIVIDFKGNERSNTRITINGMPVKEAGKLIVKFSHDGQEISFSINVKIRESLKIAQFD